MPARKKVKGRTNTNRRKASSRKTGTHKKSATFRKKRASPRKAKPKAKAAKKPKSASRQAQRAATPMPSLPTQHAPPGERIGVVTHYYSHLSVATLRLESGALRVGDMIHIRGHTTDFSQTIESLEVNHMAVTEVGPKDDFGLKVVGHVREHDVIYKVHS